MKQILTRKQVISRLFSVTDKALSRNYTKRKVLRLCLVVRNYDLIIYFI